MSYTNTRNNAEIAVIRTIAESGNDRPVLMLNLNRYSTEANFPDGELYRQHMAVLERFVPVVGAKILWRHPIHGQVTGAQPIHEALAAWYPSHQAFLDLPKAPGADENYRLRALAVEKAVIHRMPGDAFPLSP